MKKLYNLFFPVWLIVLAPPLFFLTLVGNFLIDMAVLGFAFYILHLTFKRQYFPVLWKVFMTGMIVDLIGGILILIAYLTCGFNITWYDRFVEPLFLNPLSSLASCLFILFIVILCGSLNYILNLKVSFKKIDLEKCKKRLLALLVAILTAPYFFFLPTEMFIKKDEGVELANPFKVECQEPFCETK